jgi:hypothetical protein
MKQLLVISVFALLFSQGCNEEDLCLIGSGTVNEYEIGVDDFENVSLLGPINLRIKQASEFSVFVDAEPEIFSELSYEVKNGTLEIGFKENVTCFETDYGVWVNVTVPDIKTVYSSGVSDIISDGDIALAQLEFIISGTANIMLTGEVSEHTIRSSGIVKAKNFGLLTNNTTINVSGSGDIEVSCANELDIDVDGLATVAYKGSPTITQKVKGTLDLINAN